jgi:hypothetical protein
VGGGEHGPQCERWLSKRLDDAGAITVVLGTPATHVGVTGGDVAVRPGVEQLAGIHESHRNARGENSRPFDGPGGGVTRDPTHVGGID